MSTELVRDPVVEAHGLYIENGKIRFLRTIPAYYGGRATRRAHIYHVAKQELWRVYVKMGKNQKRVPSYYTPITYIEVHILEPVWPKHLQVDKGL